MKLCAIDHKEKTENGRKYERDEFTVGEHYSVVRFINHYEDGDILVRICVNISYEDRHYNYFPEIYYEDDMLAGQDGIFKIQTTSYGAMSLDEIKKVIAGYQEAMKAVEAMTEYFC